MQARLCFILVGLFWSNSLLFSQEIPLGTWRAHSSYQTAKSIAIGSQKIYCATSNGLFSLDKNDKSLETLSKISGLSNSNVAQLAYHEGSQSLLIVYQDSNIDILKGNTVKELSLIRDSPITSSKKINHIYFEGDFAYLSSDFGVIVLDMPQQIIKETWQNLGSGGTRIAIRAATISQDSVFLASENGILRAPKMRNLLDFNNWIFFTAAHGLPNALPQHIISRAGSIYLAFEQQGIYKYTHQHNWQPLILPSNSPIYNLELSQNKVLASLDAQVWEIDQADALHVISHPLMARIHSAKQDTQGNLWLADSQSGLLGNQRGDFEAYFPNGPARAEGRSISFGNGKIVATSGGFDANYNPLNQRFGFYQFEEGKWSNFNAFDARFSENIPPIKDLSQATFDARSRNWYFASFGEGVLIQKTDNTFEQLNLDSPTATWQADATGSLKITDITADASGGLWFVQHSVSAGQASLHYQNSEGGWRSFVPSFVAGRHPLDILIDFSQNKWIRLSPERGGGIWVFNETSNQSRYLSTQVNQGNLPSQRVNAFALDQNGQIWIGTDQGVAVFFSPNSIFDASVNAVTPIFDLRPLLRAEQVNAIAIDGGNRKWIGTNNGLWLFDEEGSTLIYHFTTQNSPLNTNQVLDLSIHPQTGEVFIRTQEGLISYRGTATAGASAHQNVKVFPNPVRPNFNGLVGISGLVNNANIKITDISGRLFYETKAEGGTASWDLTDYNGVRASAGIYLIFSSNFDGSETLVSKVAIVE